MTTEFTSLIKATQTKSSVLDKLSLKMSSSVDNGFDSLLSNVSKNYVTKPSAEKTSYFADKNYAQITKDTKTAKSVVENSSKNTTALKDKAVETADKKQVSDNKTETKQNELSAKNTTSEKIADSKTTQKETIETEDSSQIKNNTEAKVQDNEPKEVVENDDMKNQSSGKQDASKQEEQSQENNSEIVAESSDVQNQKLEVTKNVLANEQIIANIEQVSTTEISEKVVKEEVSDASKTDKNDIEKINTDVSDKSEVKADKNIEVKVDNKTTEVKVDNKTTEATKVFDDVLKQTEKVSSDIDVKQISKEVTEQIKKQVSEGKVLSNAVLGQSVEQVVADAVSKETVIAQDLKTVKNPNTSEVLGDTTNVISDGSSVETNVNIDVKFVDKDSLETLKQNAQQQSDISAKTVKDSLATDISRYTINIENMTNEVPEEIKVITPTVKQEISTENIQTTIKVTEEVASQVKANEITVGKDFTTNVKDKADSKMSALKDTNTIVTNVQNATDNEVQSNLNQNNSSFTQTNANEQVARMSVDNSEINLYSNNAADRFFAKLDSKLSATTKLASQNSLLNKTDILNQMNAKFSEMQQAGQNKVSIILQPENLGKVAVEIMNSKDGIVAKMTTENQQVKELFDKNIEALKSSLGAQGVNVNNIKVECTHETSNNAMNFEREQFNQSNFNNSNGQNRQTNNSENSQTSYTTNDYATSEDATEEANNTVEIKNTETIIKHDGKVDYKV